MEKPIISQDFTIEDIHKIREYNYEVTKIMSIEEKIAYYNAAGREVEGKIECCLVRRLNWHNKVVTLNSSISGRRASAQERKCKQQ